MEKREVIKARILDFKTIKEGESEYELEDGARIILKTRLENIFYPLDDKGNPECDELGNIKYTIEGGTVIKVVSKNRIKYMPKPPEVKK